MSQERCASNAARSTTISGLDATTEHCFSVQARYTEERQFPVSNQRCSKASTPEPKHSAPIARNDAVTIDQSQSAVISLLDNDIQLDDAPLTVTLVDDPAGGTALMSSNGDVTYLALTCPLDSVR